MTAPLVSILIPAHNASPWLAETLSSALAQTWPHKEIIVVENGSVDNTLALARSYEGAMVKVLSIPRASAAVARNHAFAASRGDVIQYLDADDLLSPDKLELQVVQLMANPRVLSMSARCEFFDGESPLTAPVQRGWPFVASQDPAGWMADLLGAKGQGGFVALHQWLTPRSLVAEAGPWNETLTVNDDGEFFCRVLMRANEIRTALQAVAYYRRHRSGTNLSSAYRLSRSHLESMFQSTNLIAAHLLASSDDPGLHRALARHYYECALFAHPTHPQLSREAEQKALAHCPKALPPPPTSRLAAQTRRIFGWRMERRLAYYYRQLKKNS